MLFSLFFHNCDSLRYPVKKSCPYKVVAYCCEIDLHPYSLTCCYHYMTKAEHPLEECIGMLNCRPDLRYSDIPVYALNRKSMTSHRPIHCTIYSPAFRSEISLVPVTYDSGKTEIDLRIMHIGRRY